MAREGWCLLSQDQGDCIIPQIFMILLLRGDSSPNPPPRGKTRGRGHAGPWLVRGLYISHDQGWPRHLETTWEIHHIYEEQNESSSARPGRSQQLEIPPSLNSKQAACFSSFASIYTNAGFSPGTGISTPARILSPAWFSLAARISQSAWFSLAARIFKFAWFLLAARICT